MSKDKQKTKTPTIFDIARASGVSYSTVSRALSGYAFVKPSTREKVLGTARALGYVPNQQARSLAGGRSNMIGVLVPALSNSYISEIIQGIDEQLARSGYNIILYTTHRHHGTESKYVATMLNGGAEGLLLVVPLLAPSVKDELLLQNFPFVLIDQEDTSCHCSTVTATNWQGAYEATRYLIDLGHQRIGCIAGLDGLSSTADRLEGYRDALRDGGIALDERLILPGDFLAPGGANAARALLDLPEPPTALFASNDMSAFGALEAVRERGWRVPEDISLVGFDDLPQALLTYPKLTTVRQPLGEMGRQAARLLLDDLENPGQLSRQVVLPTELIVRESCAPPRRNLRQG